MLTPFARWWLASMGILASAVGFGWMLYDRLLPSAASFILAFVCCWQLWQDDQQP